MCSDVSTNKKGEVVKGERKTMEKIIGIDIGGTTIKADLYDLEGRSLKHYKEVSTSIDYERQSNHILEQVCCLIEEYNQDNTIYGVGIATAGVVNSQTGEVVYAGYTIPGYCGTNFKQTILERFQLPVAVENDVNCAALGEAWLGNARGLSNLVMLTVGTGIGGSVIINNQILNGHQFTAGEVGYLPVKGQDWQNLASAKALMELYKEKSGIADPTGPEFFADIKADNPIAQETLATFIDHFTEGILTISYLLNPEVIIIGGGIFSESALLLSKIRASLAQKVKNARFLPRHIIAASLGNEAGRIGAVKHFLNTHQ